MEMRRHLLFQPLTYSLTRPIFLSSLLVLSAQLKITLRRATFFSSFVQSYANIRPPSES